jgi:predicted  nucleic acid-binding Zn-ribbon protein
MSRPFFLYSLQQIDSQLDGHRNRLLEIEATLSNNSKLKQTEAKAQKAKFLLEAAKKELRNAETKVKDQRLKIELTEAALYGGKIRNPKELQDLQNEAGALRRFLETLEDRQLEAMLHMDEIEEQHNNTLDVLEKVRAEIDALHNNLINEKTNIYQAIQTLEAQRDSCLPDILPGDLDIYNILRQSRAGVAVAKIRDQACSACGATLTAATYQAARSPSQVIHCESCDRILFAG